MSGTAFGTVVLHVTPESARGGPLAFVRDGDLITLDVQNRVLDLLIDSDEIASRRSQPCAPPATNLAETRGWRKLSVEHVLSATDGADLDFMTGTVEPA
jgi:dihydroxy-acid dehydratase